ncbi:MAG: tRNA (adenosine(37)-N6)-dimethylallyltransferase MiaA [Patescibacteria group bacterium]
MDRTLPKLIVILGPTGSGKTDLGIAVAKKYNGEIISADSRQIYKQMNIGTAKPKGEWQDGAYTVNGVPHYLMDIINPDENFTVADFKEQATFHINDILKRKKLPIIVGGTGLYIQSIVDNLDIPKVAPSTELRSELEKKTQPELIEILKQLDPESAEKIDLKNPRRVLRALEVAMITGESFFNQRKKQVPLYDAKEFGINISKEELYRRLDARVDQQIKDGLVEEVKNLSQKYSWDLPSMSGIGYKQIGCFLRGEMTLEQAIEVLKRDTRRYAKRQMTWFKKDQRINWITDLEEFHLP